jgi:DNA polymerase III epsilon subunit-like protein
MEIVAFDLKTTGSGCSPNCDEIVALSAIKWKLGHPQDTQRYDTLAQCRPPLPSWLTPADLLNAPVLKQALVDFSRFVGDAWLVAEDGPARKMPFIHEACARHHLATREVRVLDSGDMARRLWGDHFVGGMWRIEERLNLPRLDELPSALANEVTRLGYAVHLMWTQLSPSLETCPVSSCVGLLPEC